MDDLNDEAKPVCIPRTRPAKSAAPHHRRTTILLGSVNPVLLQEGFGAYLRVGDSAAQAAKPWTKQDQQRQSQRLKVVARFICFALNKLDRPFPTCPKQADIALVACIGISTICDAFIAEVESQGVRGSTLANHGFALKLAARYAIAKLDQLAGESDAETIVQMEQVGSCMNCCDCG